MSHEEPDLRTGSGGRADSTEAGPGSVVVGAGGGAGRAGTTGAGSGSGPAGNRAGQGDSGVADTPPDVVELGPGWPGWVLRAVVLAAGLGSVSVLLGDGFASIVLGLMFAFAFVVPALPASPAPAILIGAVAIAVTAIGGDPLRPEVLIAIPLLHLVHAASSVAAFVPLRAVVQPRALLAPARRFVLVQLVVFAVVAVAAVLPTGRNTTIVELAGLLASAGLVALAIRLLTR
jgi:hypothetical protein